MISFLLITHETLGESLIRCAQHIMAAPIPALTHLTVSMHEDPDIIYQHAQVLLKKIDTGAGVILFTDIVGGTPSNIASRLIQAGQIEAIAGVNLPMLVRAITYRNKPLKDVIEKALTGGQDGVVYITSAT